MTVTLLLTNKTTVNVSYLTDLEDGATAGNFTIMDIQGLSDAETSLGLDFQQVESDIATFKTFATANHLALIRIDNKGREVLVKLSNEDSSSVLKDFFSPRQLHEDFSETFPQTVGDINQL